MRNSATWSAPRWSRDLRRQILYLDQAPYGHDEYRREVTDRQIELMHKRGIWVRPGQDDAG